MIFAISVAGGGKKFSGSDRQNACHQDKHHNQAERGCGEHLEESQFHTRFYTKSG